MGEYTEFRCRVCGYHTEKVRWGAGQNDARIRFLPAFCYKCRNIVEVELTGRDVLMEKFTCSNCESQVFFLKKGKAYDCPRCGATNLQIVQEGYW